MVASHTFLRGLPRGVAREIIDAGRVVVCPAGRLVSTKRPRPGVAIVVDGLVRVFLESPRQRQVTVRYVRQWETLGLVQLLGARIDVRMQAVTAATFLALSPRRVRSLAEQSATFAIAIAEECAARTADAVEEIALLAFGSVRQQVARHLLDLATCDGPDGALMARVTQQEIADATGSVRVVVARALKELTKLGLTRSGPRGVIILDAAGLDPEARTLGREPPPR